MPEIDEGRIRESFGRQRHMATLGVTIAHIGPGEVHLAMRELHCGVGLPGVILHGADQGGEFVVGHDARLIATPPQPPFAREGADRARCDMIS